MARTECASSVSGFEKAKDTEACTWAFALGALNAWNGDDQRWLSYEEVDESLRLNRQLLLSRPKLSTLSPSQVLSPAFLFGFLDGALWMRDDAPRA